MVSSEIRLLCIVGLIINVALCSILAVGVKKVHDNRNQIQFSARHYQPLITTLVLSLVFLGVERNLQLFGSVGMFFDLTFVWRWTLSSFFGFALLAGYTLRAWLPHFDYHTGVAMFTRVTNIKLKPEEVEAFEWFIENKTHYGSPKYLNKFLTIMVCGLTIMALVWTLISPRTFHFALTAFFVVVGVVAYSVVRKLMVLDDELFIRREMLMHFQIIAAFYIVTGLFTWLGPAIGWPVTGWVLCEASSICVFAMGCISTFWMLDKSEVFTIPLLMDKIALEKGDKSETDQFCEANQLPTFEEMIENPVAVANFLKHLVWELSVENLFFLSEVMRFKAAFVQEKRIAQMGGFYRHMPPLLARYQFKPELGFIPYAWAISKAYVDNLSAFYVTGMDEDVREQILDFLSTLELGDEDRWQAHEWQTLANVFDRAAEHVFILAKQAYGRFVRSPKDTVRQLKKSGGHKTQRQMEAHIAGGTTHA